MRQYQNTFVKDPDRWVMFVDMTSFFASCEQQDNWSLRNRAMGVSVYPKENYGAVIAVSRQAKERGIKGIHRLYEILRMCPDFITVETNPQRYRSYHIRIMDLLRSISPNVFPKSIDEGIVNLNDCKLLYKDVKEIAFLFKRRLASEIGDDLKCKIGIAPNGFLAKLGTEIAPKPGDIVIINAQNIDAVLSKLQLTDLPGIDKGMYARFVKAGIHTPLQLRHTDPSVLRRAAKSILGIHWHYRLNFGEVDMYNNTNYKTMGATRQISQEQRASLDTLNDLLQEFCNELEQRMVGQGVFCHVVTVIARYGKDEVDKAGNKISSARYWREIIKAPHPIQGANELVQRIRARMENFQKQHNCEPIINHEMTMFGITVSEFVDAQMLQVQLFEKNVQWNAVRGMKYNLNTRYKWEAVLMASGLGENKPLKDVIGFGSVKDLNRLPSQTELDSRHYTEFFYEDPDLFNTANNANA